MKEIGAKRVVLDHVVELAVRRRDDPHVDREFLVVANGEHPPLLEHAQQLRLEIQLEIADLIEKEDAAAGGANQPWPLAFRARERAAAVAEQLAFRQAGADRAAVHRDERSHPATRIEAMDRPRGDFLASASLAVNQDRHIGHRAGAHDPPEDRGHVRARSDDAKLEHLLGESFVLTPTLECGVQEIADAAVEQIREYGRAAVEHLRGSGEEEAALDAERPRARAVRVAQDVVAEFVQMADVVQDGRAGRRLRGDGDERHPAIVGPPTDHRGRTHVPGDHATARQDVVDRADRRRTRIVDDDDARAGTGGTRVYEVVVIGMRGHWPPRSSKRRADCRATELHNDGRRSRVRACAGGHRIGRRCNPSSR